MPFYRPRRRIINDAGTSRLRQDLEELFDVPIILSLLAGTGLAIAILLLLK